MSNPAKDLFFGKQALVTGASSGIGRATAESLASLGASVTLVARDQTNLDLVKAKLPAASDKVKHLSKSIDLSKTDEVVQNIRQLASDVGGFHVCVHAAGTHAVMPLRFATLSQARDLMTTNYESGVAIAKACADPAVLLPEGSLTFISSVVAHAGQPAVSLYAATKGAIEALSRSIAVELAPSRRRVNCIAAGLVQTPLTARLLDKLSTEDRKKIEEMHPLGLGVASDVARGVSFLAASRWVTGTTLFIDGGYTAR